MDTPAATEALPRLRRRPAAQARYQYWFAQGALFLCGLLSWVGTPKFGRGDPAFPITPLQAGIPLAGLAALALILVHYGTRFPKIIRSSIAARWLVAGCGLIFLGASVHLSGGDLGKETVLFLGRWSLPFFFLLILRLLLSMGGTFSPILYGFIVGAALSALAVVLSRAGLNLPTGLMGEGRASGFTGHPNQYGIIASGTAPFLVYFLQSPRRSRQLLGVLALGGYGLVLFQALSKTNLLLFPAALLLTFLATALNRPRAFVRALLLVGVLSVALAGLAVVGFNVARDLAPREMQTVEKTFDDPLDSKTLSQREDAWEEVVENLKRHPVLGLGPGWTENNLKLTHAHNLYLQIYVDAGLAGFIGIILVTLAVLLRTWEVLRAIAGIGDDFNDADRIQVMAALALIFSLLGNSTSSSLTIGTMGVFVVILGIAFVRPNSSQSRLPAGQEPGAQ